MGLLYKCSKGNGKRTSKMKKRKITITESLREWGYTPKQIKSINNHLHCRGIRFADIERLRICRMGDGTHIRAYTNFEDGMIYEYIYNK